MKTLFTFLVLAFFFTNAAAQEIEATLGGNTTTDGFSVKDNAANILFRVNGSGNVGIGTDSPTHALDVVNSGSNFTSVIRSTSTDGNGLAVRVENATSGNALDIASFFGQVFNVDAGGVVKGNYGTYHAPSDVRLKKEISTIPDALSKVMGLRGVNFKWKDPQRDQSMQMGLIAQEVEKVVPEVVHTADDAMRTKSVEYQYLVGLLVEAVKEQQKQIEALEDRINSITSKEPDSGTYGYIKTSTTNATITAR